jgi:hypothetical protein
VLEAPEVGSGADADLENLPSAGGAEGRSGLDPTSGQPAGLRIFRHLFVALL